MSDSQPYSPPPEFAHAMRTALHTVMGVTGLLGATRLDDEQREYLEAIRSGTDGLLGLLNPAEDAADASLERAGSSGMSTDEDAAALPATSGEAVPPAASHGSRGAGAHATASADSKGPKQAKKNRRRPATAPSRPQRDDKDHRVLVVEDNLINRRVMVRLMEQLGFETHAACDGVEALELVGRHRYAIVFMDLQMPRMDGLEAMREIRKMDITPSPRIVVLTASVGPEDRRHCTEAGADDFLAKPVRADAIKAAVSRTFNPPREDRRPQRK